MRHSFAPGIRATGGFEWAVAALMAVLGLPFAHSQATPLADAAALRPGSIEGRVVRAEDGSPAVGARVALGAATVEVVTDREGRFLLRPVPAGSHELNLGGGDGVPVKLVDVVVRPGQSTEVETIALPWAAPPGATPAARRYTVEPGRTLVFPYRHWTVTEEVLSSGPPGAFDELGVKNPSIVYHGGAWHLFYTSKPLPTSDAFKTALGYTSAATLDGLAAAPRTELRPILGASVIAPQVIFFEPQGLWYLIGHVGEPTQHRLDPVYSTNKDIADVRGWTPVRPLEVPKDDPHAFWIDFWVICDERKAHLFYSDHSGRFFRAETPLADFPHGFSRNGKNVAFELSGRNARGDWRFYNAGHVYRIKSAGKYLAVIEGAYAHPTRKRLRDARNRFLTAMLADRLEGPWRPIEARQGEFMAEDRWLFDAAGERMSPRPVSHPEIIRAGYDQRLELEDFRFQILFQTFDATQVETNYNYHSLPWRLMLMRNY